MTRELILPPDFDDYGWEVESKGVFWSGAVRVEGSLIDVTFYDPVRLQQDIESDLESGRLFTRTARTPWLNLQKLPAEPAETLRRRRGQHVRRKI